MRISVALKTLLSARHAEFTKRLIRKRTQLAGESLFAYAAASGTWSYWIRGLHVPWLEFAFTPEATISRVLEQCWDLSLWQPAHLRSPIVETLAHATPDQLAPVLAQVEWRLTSSYHSARALSQNLDLVSYIKYRIKQEHPIAPYMRGYGITDALIVYAIEQSKFVFVRQFHDG